MRTRTSKKYIRNMANRKGYSYKQEKMRSILMEKYFKKYLKGVGSSEKHLQS
jgi:hypothetical protein